MSTRESFVFKQKTAYEMRISDWSSDVCSSDLVRPRAPDHQRIAAHGEHFFAVVGGLDPGGEPSRRGVDLRSGEVGGQPQQRPVRQRLFLPAPYGGREDRKSTRLNSSH